MTRMGLRSMCCAAIEEPQAFPLGHRHRRPDTLVVGLGNPILGDDGVGWRVADALERRLATDDAARAAVGAVEVDRLAVGGLTLMERLVGYRRVVLVDACLDGNRPGFVRTTSLADMECRLADHLDCAHDVPLTEAIRVGRSLGGALPSRITVVGISVRSVGDFRETLSRAVERAVDAATDAVITALCPVTGRTC